MYCSCYSNTWVLEPSPFQEISSRDLRRKRGSSKNKERSYGPLLWFQQHEGRRGHSFNSSVGIMPTNDENLKMEISSHVGSALTPLLGKKEEGSVSMSLAKPQGQGSLITKTSSSALGPSNRHTSRLKLQRTD
jgi:hypothetical protein